MGDNLVWLNTPAARFRTNRAAGFLFLGGAIFPPSTPLIVVLCDELLASTFSSHSFSIYLLHHMDHIWPLWIYGVAYGEEPTEFWQKAMPLTWSLPLAAIFLVACYPLFRWMDRHPVRGVEGLMRWLCD